MKGCKDPKLLRFEFRLIVVVRRRTLRAGSFSQGVYAGSCGICCLSSVLALHGLVPAHSLRDMAYRTRGLPARIWRTLGSSFFTGLGAKELMAACSELDLPLQLRSSFEAGQSKCASVFTLEQLLEKTDDGSVGEHKWRLHESLEPRCWHRGDWCNVGHSASTNPAHGFKRRGHDVWPLQRLAGDDAAVSAGMRAQQPRWIYRVPSSHRAEVELPRQCRSNTWPLDSLAAIKRRKQFTHRDVQCNGDPLDVADRDIAC